MKRMRVWRWFFFIYILIGMNAWAVGDSDDPLGDLERAIAAAATEITTSVNGLDQTITINAQSLLELLRLYLPRFESSARLIADGATRTGDATQTAVESLPIFVNTATEVNNAAIQITQLIGFLNSILENPATQITLYTVGGIIAVGTLFYIADCLYRIGSGIYGWCVSEKQEENDFQPFELKEPRRSRFFSQGQRQPLLASP
jgi:hypothetical protein